MKREPGYVPIYWQPASKYPKTIWWWPNEPPDPKLCGNELHQLSSREMHLLGESALALWYVMLKLRGASSNTLDEDWYPYSKTPKHTVKMLAHKIGLTFETAKRALRRLRECGAVTTKKVSAYSRTRFHAGNAPCNWHAGVLFSVWGAFAMNKDHSLVVLLPREKFLNWACGRMPWGRSEMARATRGHLTHKMTPRPPQGDFPAVGSPSKINNLQGKMTPVQIMIYSPVDPGESADGLCPQRTAGQIASFARSRSTGQQSESAPLLAIVNQPATPTVPGEAFDDALYAALAGEHKKCRPVLREPTTARPVLPPLDPVPTERSGGSSMSAGMTPAYYAGQLVSAYRQAVQSIYGQQSNCYRFKGITEKSKHFGFLLAAAQVMVEEEIAPATWALWWMRKLKTGKDDENVSAFAERPPPMRVIFAQSTLRKHHGWFHHDAEDSSATAKVGRVHLEQMYRHREATNIWRGMTPRQARLSTESWYDEMREEECKMGHEDPLDFYPRATAGSC